MAEIEIDFQKYLPNIQVIFSYFEILKEHKFIEDVQIVEKEDEHILRVFRHMEEIPIVDKPPVRIDKLAYS